MTQEDLKDWYKHPSSQVSFGNAAVQLHTHIPSISESQSSVRYILAGTSFEVLVSRDIVSQLITMELFDREADGAPISCDHWHITAYQHHKFECISGGVTARVIASPFYSEVRFYQKTFGLLSEVASLICNPKILKPGDIPVHLNGAWVTRAGGRYSGRPVSNQKIYNRYLLSDSKIIVDVGRLTEGLGGFFSQLSIFDESGAVQALGTWVFPLVDFETKSLRVGQYVVKILQEENRFSFTFTDRSIGLFPTELGFLGLEFPEASSDVRTTEVYLSGPWSEMSINFDPAVRH